MKALVVGVVGAGCIAAAGVGGYLAVREGSASSAAAPAATQLSEATVRSSEVAALTPEPASAVVPAPATAPAPRPAGAVRPVSPPPTKAPAPPAATGEGSTTQPSLETRPTPVESAAEAAPSPVTDPERPHTTGPVDEVQIPSPEAPRVTFEELTVTRNGVIGIRLDTPVSSETAKVEDRVMARVARDVTVDGRVAVPAGATFEGYVTEVERGGRFRERARLGVRFTTLVMPDNTRVSVSTDPIYRLGDAPTGEATSKIGAATVVGTIIGAAIGGKKGAAIGGATGAAGGTAAVMSSGPNFVVLPAGTSLTVRLTEPATFQVPLER